MKHSFKLRIVTFAVVIGLLFTACGGGGGDPSTPSGGNPSTPSGGNETPATVAVTGVALNKSSTGLAVGRTETIFANVEPSNASNKTVSWSSSNTDVATVSQSGVVTAIAEGSATITVTTSEGNKRASCTVQVSTGTVAVTGISLNKQTANLVAGGTENLFSSITPSGATDQSVSWNSSNNGVATVTQGGVVTGVKAGTATITVRTSDGGKTASCAFTVTAPAPAVTKVTVSPATTSVTKGKTQQFSAQVEGTNNPAQTVTWTVTGGGSGTSVNSSGLLTVSATESAANLTVKATSTADTTKSGTANVTVSAAAPTVTKVTVSPANASVATGKTQQFSAQVEGSNNPAQIVTWTVTGGVSGTSISTSGLLTVAAYESAKTLTVKATSTVDTSKSGTATVTVNNDGDDGTNIDRFKFKEVSGGVEVSGYIGSAKDIRIPERINGKAVVSIGERAFFYANLTSVTIPSSVTSIKELAFSVNRLTSVTIPRGVTTIGGGAFANNQLTSIDIPPGITVVGGFAGNQLTSVTIPQGVTTIEERAFSNNQLTSVSIPNSVTTIGDSAFEFNQLTSVTIPSSVTTIGSSAFMENQLTSVTIPPGVTTIEALTFRSNQLTSVTIPPGVTVIGNGAFENNFQLTSVDIPNSVTAIGNGAFAGNNLTSIDIPASVRTIGDEAFYSNNLTSVVIPPGVTTIGTRIFADNQLTSVTIPPSVTTIRGLAFYSNQLTSVTIGTNVTIDNNAFDFGNNSFREVYDAHSKSAGTYTRPTVDSDVWTYSPQ